MNMQAIHNAIKDWESAEQRLHRCRQQEIELAREIAEATYRERRARDCLDRLMGCLD